MGVILLRLDTTRIHAVFVLIALVHLLLLVHQLIWVHLVVVGGATLVELVLGGVIGLSWHCVRLVEEIVV